MTEYDREWKRRNPDRVKASSRRKSLRKRYGISPTQYEALWNAQGGLCAICGQAERNPDREGQPRRLAVDHDKRTGRVRGLLCRLCNQRLGALGDDRAGVMRFLSYIDAPPAEQVDLVAADRKWSRHHDRCIECGRSDRKHGGYGLCHPCNVRRLRRGDAPPQPPQRLVIDMTNGEVDTLRPRTAFVGAVAQSQRRY